MSDDLLAEIRARVEWDISQGDGHRLHVRDRLSLLAEIDRIRAKAAGPKLGGPVGRRLIPLGGEEYTLAILDPAKIVGCTWTGSLRGDHAYFVLEGQRNFLLVENVSFEHWERFVAAYRDWLARDREEEA